MGLLDPPVTKQLRSARFQGVFNPLPAAPVISSDIPTIGSLRDVSVQSNTDISGSTVTYPVAIPYYINSQAVNGISARYKNYGFKRVAVGSGSGASAYARAVHPDGNRGGACTSSIEFIFDGQVFEPRIRVYNNSSIGFQLFVDDLPISDTTNYIGGITNGFAYSFPITFTTKKLRRLRLEFDSGQAFGGIIVGNNDFMQASGGIRVPQMYLCGDSYSDGAAGTSSLDTYASRLGRILGMDTWVDGQGGTGFVATSGTPKTNYINRIIPCGTESSLSPDLVVLQTSTNDGNSPLQLDVQLRVAEAIAQCRLQWPKAKIVVVGLMLMVGSNYLSSTNLFNHLTSKAASNATYPLGADLFVDPFPGISVAGQFDANSWYTGTANVDTAAGNTGNSGIYRSNDNIHGSPAWHPMAARIIASKIVGLLATA